jgi:hypothetical protein
MVIRYKAWRLIGTFDGCVGFCNLCGQTQSLLADLIHRETVRCHMLTFSILRRGTDLPADSGLLALINEFNIAPKTSSVSSRSGPTTPH